LNCNGVSAPRRLTPESNRQARAAHHVVRRRAVRASVMEAISARRGRAVPQWRAACGGTGSIIREIPPGGARGREGEKGNEARRRTFGWAAVGSVRGRGEPTGSRVVSCTCSKVQVAWARQEG